MNFIRAFSIFLLSFSFINIHSQNLGKAANFKLEDVDGNVISMNQYLGKKVILLDFWASWCIPCLAEMAHFEEMYNELKDQGFIILAISVDDPQTMARVRPLVISQGYTFPVLRDIDKNVFQLYNATAVPTSFVIDLNGNIIKRTDSFQAGDEKLIKEAVLKALSQKKTDSQPQSEVVQGIGPLQLAGSNFLRANYGKEDANDESQAGWFENWFDFRINNDRLSYQTRFRAYQFLKDEPGSDNNIVRNPNQRIVKQRFKYDGDYTKILAGNIYTNLGRGLLLRTWEERFHGIY